MTMHDGHRRRLRERFRLEGLENFAPHEVLELLLFYARARGDVNPLAHRLLEVFGTLRGVLEAPVDQLCAVEGIGEETAALISLMVPMFRRYEMCLCEKSRKLARYSEVQRYCTALMAGLRKERFYVICVSSQMRVLGQRLIAEGSLSEVPAYPRLVVETALNQNAYGIILCHNHPGGEAIPSMGDVDVTRELGAVLAKLGIALMEHIIVADNDCYSMIQHGDYQCSIVRSGKQWYFREDGMWDDEWA